MRIISDFKDYYDSVQGYGMDPALVYVRKQEQFSVEIRPYEDRKAWMPPGMEEAIQVPFEILTKLPTPLVEWDGKWRTTRVDIDVTVKLIGFCGRLFPMIEVDGKTFHSTEKMEAGLSVAFLKEHQINRKRLSALLDKEYKSYRSYGRWSLPRHSLTHANWQFAISDLADKRFDSVFVELGVPVFKLEYTPRVGHKDPSVFRCTLNPFLKPEQFQRIIGPAEAFQEIALYMGNQLATQPDPTSNITDEILRDEKGFNEWSFRRHKEESKKFKRKRKR